MLRPVHRKQLATWPDDRLVQAFRRTRNERYFDVLYDRYLPVVYGICLHLTRDRAAAKDLTQVAFTHAYRALSDQDIADVLAWLRTIVYNSWKSRYRQLLREETRETQWAAQQPMEETLVETLPFSRPTPEATNLQVRLLAEAMQELPAQQRICLEHFYYSQLSYKEIAARCGETEKWVKSQLQNGKRQLRHRIAQRLDELKNDK